MRTVAEKLEVLVAEVEQVGRLLDGDHAKGMHPFDTACGWEPCVLDPRTWVHTRTGSLRALEAVEHEGDGPVALRVDADPPAGRPRPLDEVDELVGLVEERAHLTVDPELVAERGGPAR